MFKRLALNLVKGKDIPKGAVVYLQPMVATTHWPVGIKEKLQDGMFYVTDNYVLPEQYNELAEAMNALLAVFPEPGDVPEIDALVTVVDRLIAGERVDSAVTPGENAPKFALGRKRV